MTEVEMKFWMDSFVAAASNPAMTYAPFHWREDASRAAGLTGYCSNFADLALLQLRERTKVKVEVVEHEEGVAHAGA